MSGGGGCRVAILAPSGFLGDYVAAELRRVGFHVSGPAATADGIELADVPCQGAVVDVGTPARELLPAAEMLVARWVPLVLIGCSRARLPVLLAGRPMLMQPFASHQVVEALRVAGLPVPSMAG